MKQLRALGIRIWMLPILLPVRLLWEGWKKVAHVIGIVNTTILLTVFYVVIFGLYALFSLPSRLKRSTARTSYWRKVPESTPTLETLARQF